MAADPFAGLTVILLGTGTSGGVPLLGFGWGACDPDHPRNHRLRTSAYLAFGEERILIDASPDFRQQWLRLSEQRLTRVLFTHAHADHCHGIDDLRFVAWHNHPPLPAYARAETLADLDRRFGYLFIDDDGAEPTDKLYKPFLRRCRVEPGRMLDFAPILPIEVDHVTIPCIGYRFGRFAYMLDVWEMDEAALQALEGIETWVVDCVGERPHATHAHWQRVEGWIERLKPRRTILSSLSAAIDYVTWSRKLPPGVELGYDGMRIIV